MWQGIWAISDYKPSNSTQTAMDLSFINKLNDFYACFDKDNKDKTIITLPPDNYHTLTLTVTDVHNTLGQINVHKAAGPDGSPGCMLQACVGQLAGVFTDIFNRSLPQAAVPVPKHLNTYVLEQLPHCSTHVHSDEVL